MKVETYFGTKKIISLVYELGIDLDLLPCPFCGGEVLEVANTHTPHYWVSCLRCSAQIDSSSLGGDAKTRRNHVRAFLSAIQKWNKRAASPEPENGGRP
jgi:hypothetical protein